MQSYARLHNRDHKREPLMTDKATIATTAGGSPLDGVVRPCPTCGSDCNERDELDKTEREIARLMGVVSTVNSRCDHLGIRLGEVIRERAAMRDALVELLACNSDFAGWSMSMVADRAAFDAMLARSQERLDAAVSAARDVLGPNDRAEPPP